MSRFTALKLDGTVVAYGLDHVLGWFYQEFDKDGECIKDLDSQFTGLGRAQLVHLLEQTSANPSRISAIALDMDPAELDAAKEVLTCYSMDS